MFTVDKKEYDETKLDGKAKVAFNNVQVLLNEKKRPNAQVGKKQDTICTLLRSDEEESIKRRG